MEFTQLLSIANRNVKKQESSTKAKPSTSSSILNVKSDSLLIKPTNGVNKNAVQSFLDGKRQADQDKVRQEIEKRRQLVDQRQKKRKSAKQKAKEEKMAQTFEALEEEERKRRAKCVPPSASESVRANLPKNNIKSQYFNGAPISKAAPSPSTPAAPLDYQTLMKMAEKKKSENGKAASNYIPPHERLKQEKAKKLEDELVHFKQPKTQKDASSQGRKQSQSFKQSSALSSLSNRENGDRRSPHGAVTGRGIAAQFGVGSDQPSRNGQSSCSNSKITTAENGKSIKEDCAKKTQLPKKGIAAQCGFNSSHQPTSSSRPKPSSKSSVCEETQKVKKKMSFENEAPQSRKRSYNDYLEERRVPMTQTSRLVASSNTQMRAAPRGIAAQLGISAAAKQRFEIEREQMYMEEEDEDCDSEFDDFIDDEELGEDVRAEVRKITGYDPRRYRDENISDYELARSMNASVSDIMKEEKRSERIGKKEDAIEFRKEQERMKKKQEAKKMK